MQKKKREKDKLSDKLEARCSLYEKNRIKGLAKLYAGGNVSLWMIYASLNAPRKFINTEELWDSKRKNRKPFTRKS